MLGNIIDEISSQDEDTPEPASEIEEAKEEATGETEAESNKQGNNNWKKVFDIREMVNLRNRSIGKLDWRNWTPGLHLSETNKDEGAAPASASTMIEERHHWSGRKKMRSDDNTAFC
ncbi:hypothetical protein OIU74_001717 [Salix koriyanagi]|uniref:Uncharacterized protein n=1 Tax=Salix koriyanagi TaxID=2511006 RepID=A0A9Q1ANE0_9ROSI|nr:hypothetical protein OIU74_001717 [Salix koriyanagi]